MGAHSRRTFALVLEVQRGRIVAAIATVAAAGSWSIRIAGSLAPEAVPGADCCSCCAASAASTVSNAAEAVEVASSGPAAGFGIAVNTETGSSRTMASAHKRESVAGAYAAGSRCQQNNHGPFPRCSGDAVARAQGY